MSKIDTISPSRLSGNPRCTLSAWLRYSHIVEAAISVHPKPYVFTPKNYSAHSVATKLRDAIRGAIAFSHSALSPEVFIRWWEETTITSDNDNVYIGPKGAPKSEAVVGETKREDLEFNFPSLNNEELFAFETLLSTGKLKGPIRIVQPSPTWEVCPFPNVERILRSDGSMILL